MKTIIFATGNMGKMNEIKEIMADLDYEILSMKEAGVEAEVEENGTTFEENARIKALAISEKVSDAIVMADDSGLEVDALDKAPGVYSARFMGEDTSYDIKNAEILKRLEGVVGDDRSARFVCAICAVFPDGEIKTVRGTIEGVIANEPKGKNGFGYDPIFFVPELGLTTGELDPRKKNEISHRGRALKLIKEYL